MNEYPISAKHGWEAASQEHRSAGPPQQGAQADHPTRAAIKILQCNNELCQYELRQDGDIESVSQSKHVVKLKLEQAPKLCLIIKKPNAPQLQQPLRDVANFMHHDLNLNIAVEPTVKAEFPDLPFLVSVGPPPQPFSDFLGSPTIASPSRYDAETLKAVDFVGESALLLQSAPCSARLPPGAWPGLQHAGPSSAREPDTECVRRYSPVCLGGDGTILWVSGLYNGPCPPIISFAMGSLGFLTPFDFDEYKEVIAKTAAGDVEIGIRTRLFACVHGLARTPLHCPPPLPIFPPFSMSAGVWWRVPRVPPASGFWC
jgi:hypothetical protein